MVVDDDPGVLISVEAVFEEQGYDVFTANGGQACIEELKNGFKGVILMDIMMPGMDGWATIQEIIDHNLNEGNIIAMLTAVIIPDIKMNPLKEYVIDFLNKPFDSETLVKIVNEYTNLLENQMLNTKVD